jgi:hypothetical protein
VVDGRWGEALEKEAHLNQSKPFAEQVFVAGQLLSE